MNDKIIGLVLTQSDYKDADVLMQVNTSEYGILTFIGKASKKLDSKNHFLPMCLYEFIIDYKDNKTIYTVHGNKLLKSYFDDRDMKLMAYKNILIESALKNKDINTFNELNFVFDNINNDNMYLLGSMFISFLAKRFGISPVVDQCAICGHKKIVSLSNKDGGFVCEKHLFGLKPISVDTLRKFRLIVKGEFKDFKVLKQFEYDFSVFSMITNFYIDNSSLNLKSYDFYRSMY